MKQIALVFVITMLLLSNIVSQNDNKLPYLDKKGNKTQYIVDDKPFLILGGELGNSSFTSLEYMAPIWSKLKKMNLNTVLVPVYWELIEPTEGKFDFNLYDQLINEAREHELKLILLWFGSWKNSMSSHAPSWVKLDQERFPRVKDSKGKSHEILTPFSKNNLDADLNAFKALMNHVKEIDGDENTIIMIQPENEIGMLPVPRDHSDLANSKFHSNVPEELMNYLIKNRDKLIPEFKDVWSINNFKESGTWEEIFGEGPHTDELFMAWYYAKFTDEITKGGKEEYNLPMFVNAALIRPGRLPGYGYPSAGPLPHLMDIWKAGAPSIDFLSPDFYNPNFEKWCDLYTRQNNPLFIPEHRFDNTVAAKALFAMGHYEALGFSPFSIESTDNPESEPLGKVYNIVEQIIPIFEKNRGENRIEGVMFDKNVKERIFNLGNYEFTAKHSYTLGYEPNSKNENWESTGALIIQTKENEFFVVGSGIVFTFKDLNNPAEVVGILKADQGNFENNKWKVIRHLNGDQTHQGRHIRILHTDGYMIQRFELYSYK